MYSSPRLLHQEVVSHNPYIALGRQQSLKLAPLILSRLVSTYTATDCPCSLSALPNHAVIAWPDEDAMRALVSFILND
jgi:hypothetical protein